MNNYYNIDSFEQFLRDKTKGFKMMPKKRVWFSIYNNIHPSKNLPSAITSLFLLFIFFSIDFLNTNYEFNSHPEIRINNIKNSILLLNTSAPLNEQSSLILENKTKKVNIQIGQLKKSVKNTTNSIGKEIKFEFEKCEEIKTNQNKTSSNFLLINNQKYVYKSDLNTIDKLNYSKKSSSSNLSYEIYASPSLIFNEKRDVNSISKNDEVNEGAKRNKHNYRYSDLNLSAGGAILYNINSSIRIKAGLELRYSKSSITNHFNENDKNQFIDRLNENTGGMFLSDNQNTFLELNSYNISIPIGSEFELAGNDHIHWYAGASLEPTFKIYDNPVLNKRSDLSIYDANKYRKWNINSNLETFLSLRINKNSFFKAGPQFRYQLFSPYNNLINSYNNSYNFGMKFGVSKTF
jgi:hypothetical protein